MPTVSMLASVADLAASQAAGAVSQLLPSGIILPFGGATPPAGWLFCNGQLVNRTTYSSLFSAIGTVHGSGDGSTTFHLPDLRGRFLRGTDIMSQNAVTTAAGRDPDKAGRLASNAGGNTGDNVGSVQGNATAKNNLTNAASSVTSNASSVSGSVGGSDGAHAHRTGTLVGGSSTNFHTWTAASTASGVTYGFGYGDHAVSATSSGHGHGISLTAAAQGGTAAAQTITGDNETRPLNANVNYIIKV